MITTVNPTPQLASNTTHRYINKAIFCGSSWTCLLEKLFNPVHLHIPNRTGTEMEGQAHTTLADESSPVLRGGESPSATASLSSPGPSAKWVTPCYSTCHVVLLFILVLLFWFGLVWLDIHIVQNSKSKEENVMKTSRPHPASAWPSSLSQKASTVEFPGFVKVQAQADWQEVAVSVPPAACSPH